MSSALTSFDLYSVNITLSGLDSFCEFNNNDALINFSQLFESSAFQVVLKELLAKSQVGRGIVFALIDDLDSLDFLGLFWLDFFIALVLFA